MKAISGLLIIYAFAAEFLWLSLSLISSGRYECRAGFYLRMFSPFQLFHDSFPLFTIYFLIFSNCITGRLFELLHRSRDCQMLLQDNYWCFDGVGMMGDISRAL